MKNFLKYIPDIVLSLFFISFLFFVSYTSYQNFKNMPSKEEFEAKQILIDKERVFCIETMATLTVRDLPVRCLKYYTSKNVQYSL